MSASMPPPTPGRRPVPPASVTLHGLASAVTLTVPGARSAELRGALETAWSRCLEPTAAEWDEEWAEPMTVQLCADADRPDGSAGPAADPEGSGEPGQSAIERPVVEGSDLDGLLQQTTQAVTRAFIAAQTGRLLMFHAGACAHPDTGATVVYVAPGGTGKTTLSRVLGRTLGYLTDETVGITPDGGIRPYPKPLSIRARDPSGPKLETSPDELDLRTAPAGPWLRRIVLLDRRDDHTESPRTETLDLADAIIALAPETSALSSLDRPLHLLADLVAATGPVLRCTYREAEQLAPVLTGLLESA